MLPNPHHCATRPPLICDEALSWLSARYFVLAAQDKTDHNAFMSPPFLEQLAEPRPFPGGGSAAAYVGALALALVEKVVRLEIKRSEKDTPATVVWNGRLSTAVNISARFRLLTQEDGRAYARMSSLRAQDCEADVIVESVKEAAMVPVQIIHAAIQGLELVSESVGECRECLVPDLQVSGELLWAVARGAQAIASANIVLLESSAHRVELQNILTEALEDARDVYAKIKISVANKCSSDIR